MTLSRFALLLVLLPFAVFDQRTVNVERSKTDGDRQTTLW
jgi:hypothetical protein